VGSFPCKAGSVIYYFGTLNAETYLQPTQPDWYRGFHPRYLQTCRENDKFRPRQKPCCVCAIIGKWCNYSLLPELGKRHADGELMRVGIATRLLHVVDHLDAVLVVCAWVELVVVRILRTWETGKKLARSDGATTAPPEEMEAL
jgi:hypothetical protein